MSSSLRCTACLRACASNRLVLSSSTVTRRPRSAMRSIASLHPNFDQRRAVLAARPALPHSEFEHRHIGGAQQSARGQHDAGRADHRPFLDRAYTWRWLPPAPHRPGTARPSASASPPASARRRSGRRRARSWPRAGSRRRKRRRPASALTAPRPRPLASLPRRPWAWRSDADGGRLSPPPALRDHINLVSSFQPPSSSAQLHPAVGDALLRSSCRIPCRARGTRNPSRFPRKRRVPAKSCQGAGVSPTFGDGPGPLRPGSCPWCRQKSP